MNTQNNHDLQTLARMVLELHFCDETTVSLYPCITSFPSDAPEKKFTILRIPSNRVDERGLLGPLYSVLSSALGNKDNSPIDELFTFKASHGTDMPPTSPEFIRVKKFVDGPWVQEVRDAHDALMDRSRF